MNTFIIYEIIAFIALLISGIIMLVLPNSIKATQVFYIVMLFTFVPMGIALIYSLIMFLSIIL